MKKMPFFLVAAMVLTMHGNFALTKAAERETGDRKLPANPVHHCEKDGFETDATDWSYIYFGSYPQGRIKDEEVTDAVIEADYDAKGDAWVGPVKYRRVVKSDAGNTGSAATDKYAYYKWERIRWRVLQTDGDTMLVSADLVLDDKLFYTNKGNYTWDKSELRKWLNGEFCGTAFSEAEQKEIVKQSLVNEDNFYKGTEGGADTEDYVFLLSSRDVTNQQYGFCWNRIGQRNRFNRQTFRGLGFRQGQGEIEKLYREMEKTEIRIGLSSAVLDKQKIYQKDD